MASVGMSAIAAGHEESAAAGAEVLQAGGNAVDAAIAATLTAAVAELGLTGPFGGGFAVVAAPGMEPEAVDFFADVPGRGLPRVDLEHIDFHGVDVSFGPTFQTFHVGKGSTAVSSILAGVLRLHRDHGRLALERVTEPAIRRARNGVTITPQTAFVMRLLEPILTLTDEARALHCSDGALIGAGQVYENHPYAELLAGLRPGATGLPQRLFLDALSPPAGLVTKLDVESYEVQVRPPLHVKVRDFDVFLNPPPSSGGLLIAFGLKLLERVPDPVWRDSRECAVHLLAAMSTTLRARAEKLDAAIALCHGDLERIQDHYLGTAFIDSWMDVFWRAVEDGPNPPLCGPEPTLGSTTHVSVLDASGMACTLTTSNGEGSGHILPGTGSLSNNFLGESDLNPGGFHANPAGMRLTSMMCPTVVLRDGAPVMALGSGGSNRIRTAMLQVLAATLFAGQNLQRAVDNPRFHFEDEKLYVEASNRGVARSPETLAALEQRCANIIRFEDGNMFFGGVHAAGVDGEAAGDRRRQGVVKRVESGR